MLLNQFGGGTASQQNNTALRDVVLTNMYSTAKILNYLQFYPMVGNSDKRRKSEGMANTGQTRSVDESYTAKTLTPAFADLSLKILGDEVKTDISHLRRGENLTEVRLAQLEEFGKNLGLFFNEQFMNGDGTGENIHGIDSLVPAGRVKKFIGNDGGTVPVGTTSAEKKSQLQFLKAMTELGGMVKGGPDVYIMNLNMVATLYGIGMNYVQKTTVQDVFGNQVELAFFGGKPILDIGYTKDGSGLIIPNNKTVGTSSDCTSIYAVKFGQGIDLSAATNVGIDVIDKGLEGVHYVTMVDFDCDLGLFDDRAIARLDGIRLEV